MATKTDNLRMLLPGPNEYKDTWWDPLNKNFELIDEIIGDMQNELVEARKGQTTLADFLSVGHEDSGELKPTPEMTAARSSKLGAPKASLSARLEETDMELWAAREGQASLRDLIAFRTMPYQSMILSGLESFAGYPNWMGSTGADVSVSGASTPLYLLIDGKVGRIRKLETLTISGGTGTKYVYASRSDDGVVTVDESSGTDGIASSELVGEENQIHYFTHENRDWSSYDVQPGDILTIVSGANAGKYIIKEIGSGANSDRLTIHGQFPSAVASMSYTITDPLGVTLGFDTTETPAAGKLYIGEAYFDGTGVADFPSETGVKVKPRHFKDTFTSEWRDIDTATNGGVITEAFNHRLGTDNLDVSIQVSQADDGSAYVMEVPLGTFVNTLSVARTGSLSLSVGNGTLTFNAGTSDASLTGTVSGSLTDTMDVALSGDILPDSNFVAKWDRNKLTIKNAVTGKFYRDFEGVVRTTGKLRVIVRKRG